jgi:hypothetical protein
MRTIITIAAVVLQITCMAASGWSQAYTRIVSPVQTQCVTGPDVKVQFEAGGVSLAPGGYNLHFKLDDEPFQVQYNGNRAHVFRNVLPGTHTVRMYIANAQHEAIPGTLSTVSFNVAHYGGANLPAPGAPMLTWNLPQGEYLGADALNVTLDFLLTNATLSPGGLQVAYYVDGRRFLIQDNCYVRHIKDLAPGLHRVRIELQDANGDLIPGAFNSGERVIAISPASSQNSASVITDNYAGSGRIASIPGAMTLGGARPQITVPLTQRQIEQQRLLTVNKEGRTLTLDGSVISEDLTEGRDPEDTGAVATENLQSAVPGQSSVPGPAEGYTVRAGSETEQETVNLDDTDTDNIRRGSIVVRELETPDAAGDDEDDSGDEPAAGTNTAAGAATSGATTRGAATTTQPLTRRRATGTTSTVVRTTETLRLDGNRPSLRQTTAETTRTVRANNAGTTVTRTPASANRQSTGQCSPASGTAGAGRCRPAGTSRQAHGRP